MPELSQDVLILGGGVAGAEALVGLRALAGERARITLVSPDRSLSLAALRPLDAFGAVAVPRWRLSAIADDHRARFVPDRAVAVDLTGRRVRLGSGAQLSWDALVVAVGAHRRPALGHCVTVLEDRLSQIVADLRRDLAQGIVGSIAFVVPPRTSWTLPLYELALMTRRTADSLGIHPMISIVSTETRPLGLFSPASSHRLGELLADAHISFMGDAYCRIHRGGRITVRPHRRMLHADRVIALPRPEGRFVAGLPHDAGGFIPVDQHGRVSGCAGVYAAGDCTTFPVKQGGLAAQQADAVASHIAAVLGAPLRPEPFRPVLHAKLVVGQETTYLRHVLSGGAGDGVMSDVALWEPPTKVHTRFLSEWLLHHEPPNNDQHVDQLELTSVGAA